MTVGAQKNTLFNAFSLAEALHHAAASGTALDAQRWPATLTADEVVAVQHAQAQRWGGAPDSAPVYWKSGGPARDLPLGHAPLPPARVLTSPAAMQQLPLLMRGIEAEIALRLAHDVTAADAASLQPGDVTGLVDAMAVSIEVVDSRWQQRLAAPDALKAADLLCNGVLALGDWQTYRAMDWSQQRCTARVGSQALVERVGSHSLHDPAWLLPQWLRHATQHFGTVRAGTVVTTGSWVGLLLAQAGDRVEVVFDGIGRAELVL